MAIGVFLDLKKAFDTVPHDILLKKLYAYGIRGIALKLMKSYLTDRTQYVIYDSMQSTTLSISCGVPSGVVGRERMGTAFPQENFCEISFHYCY